MQLIFINMNGLQIKKNLDILENTTKNAYDFMDCGTYLMLKNVEYAFILKVRLHSLNAQCWLHISNLTKDLLPPAIA